MFSLATLLLLFTAAFAYWDCGQNTTLYDIANCGLAGAGFAFSDAYYPSWPDASLQAMFEGVLDGSETCGSGYLNYSSSIIVEDGLTICAIYPNDSFNFFWTAPYGVYFVNFNHTTDSVFLYGGMLNGGQVNTTVKLFKAMGGLALFIPTAYDVTNNANSTCATGASPPYTNSDVRGQSDQPWNYFLTRLDNYYPNSTFYVFSDNDGFRCQTLTDSDILLSFGSRSDFAETVETTAFASAITPMSVTTPIAGPLQCTDFDQFSSISWFLNTDLNTSCSSNAVDSVNHRALFITGSNLDLFSVPNFVSSFNTSFYNGITPSSPESPPEEQKDDKINIAGFTLPTFWVIFIIFFVALMGSAATIIYCRDYKR